MAQRPARGPPCVAPGCKAPERGNTQYTFVPAEKGAELGACVCKAASCLRWAGLRAEAKQAGRKRKAEAPPEMATLVNGVAYDRVGDLTGRRMCPAFIDEIHEVWGSRCDRCATRFAPHAVLTVLVSFVARRYVDLETLGEEERGNMLSNEVRRLEYAVHGKFARSETDKNGLHDAFWVPLTVLAEQFDRDDLEAKLEAYETRLNEQRTRAVEAAFAAASEVEGEEEEEAGHA